MTVSEFFKELWLDIKQWFSGVDIKGSWKRFKHKGFVYILLVFTLIAIVGKIVGGRRSTLNGMTAEEVNVVTLLFNRWTETLDAEDVTFSDVNVLEISDASNLGMIYRQDDYFYWQRKTDMLYNLRAVYGMSKSRQKFELEQARKEEKEHLGDTLHTRIDTLRMLLLRERIRHLEDCVVAPDGFGTESIDAEIEYAQQRSNEIMSGDGVKIRLTAAVNDTLCGFVFYKLRDSATLRLFSVFDPTAPEMKDPVSEMDLNDSTGRMGAVVE